MKFKTKINSKKLSVGFIGAGNMALPMIKNIIKAGFDVKVFDWNIKVTKKLESIYSGRRRSMVAMDRVFSQRSSKASCC